MQAAFDDNMSMTTTVNKALPVSLMFVMTCMYCGIMDNAVDEVTGKAPAQWTSRCTNTGKALNSTCMTCKLVLSKMLRHKMFLDKCSTWKLLSQACMRHGGDPEIRQEFLTAREKQVYLKKQHGSDDKRHNILDIAPRTSSRKSTSVNLAVRGADVDLIPEEVFARMTGGKSFKQTKVTPVNIGGKEGILVYATSWNPPPGCWRVVRNFVSCPGFKSCRLGHCNLLTGSPL
jgi:hypothetical protein